jgi:DNA invertase Pin-like site-specific DNA recombinase
VRIDFVSLSEQVDTSTPTGKMVFTVLGALPELERSLIAERVRAGIRNARAQGKRLGKAANRRGCFQNRRPAISGALLGYDPARNRHIAKGTAQRAFYSLPQIAAPLTR